MVRLSLLGLLALCALCHGNDTFQGEKGLLLKRLLMALEKRSDPSSCTAKYREMGNSTMCLYQDDPNAQNRGVSDAEKQKIVDQHNQYRAKVDPTAANMQKMYWDDEIAVIAQKWTNTCPPGHDKDQGRKVPGYGIWIGQNWAQGYSSWQSAIFAWYDEVRVYRYGVNPSSYLTKEMGAIGHYTQVVRDIAARVGCGYAKCPSGPIYICNYAFGNAVDLAKPYESGPSCSKCGATCSGNLCDCKGKICLNGGTLDPNTCSCTCVGAYNGDMCQNLNCPAKDKSHCVTQWPASYCNIYNNVPQDCPYMCGICPGKGGSSNSNSGNSNSNNGNSNSNSGNSNSNSGNSNSNNGNSNSNNGNSNSNNGNSNSVSGNNGDDANCPMFDKQCCDKWPVSYCDEYYNVPGDCPIMCGKCKEKCPGKGRNYCTNGGTLQSDCTCSCTNKWKGDKCQYLVNCPASDSGWACHNFYKKEYCIKYYNVPQECPHLCGLCL